ncbi:MAG: VWA domain-containing protein [Pyrinomonadaceae bacterium]
MSIIGLRQIAFVLAVFSILQFNSGASAQSRPQRPESPKGDQKKNNRPSENEIKRAEEAKKKAEEEKKRLAEEKNSIIATEVEKVNVDIVNVDAVVINKKTGQIISGLKKENFAVFENGARQNVSSFATPESPITVTLVLEYSKWSEVFGSAAGGYFEPGVYETIRPVAQFVSRFIKPPDDYASVIAFDMRPTTITDFTNDPARLQQTVSLLLRNRPAFRENNLYDAIKFALVGGKGDSVVLENSEQRTAEFSGMTAVRSKRKAIILVASGIDTFSRINYGDARKVIQESGIPIYIISTGNLFYKKYEGNLPATDGISGMPGRLTFLQAKNAMNTFAKESGGMHFEMTFESEIPDYLASINGLLRSQYSLAYDLEGEHKPGKKYKIDVKVDVDGDGQYDDKQFTVQHRLFYSTPSEKDQKK